MSPNHSLLGAPAVLLPPSWGLFIPTTSIHQFLRVRGIGWEAGSRSVKPGSGRRQEIRKKYFRIGDGSSAPEPPKVPGERRPELPYEVRPEILPLQDQPNRSQPSPTEVKPPNPQTIVCSSDNVGSSGSNDDMIGKVVEFGSSVGTTESKGKQVWNEML